MADRYTIAKSTNYNYNDSNNNLGLYSFPVIDPQEVQSDDDIIYLLKQFDTIDGLAFQYYGDEKKYYIIMLANGMSLPTDLNPNGSNRIIRIPKTPERIDSLIKRRFLE